MVIKSAWDMFGIYHNHTQEVQINKQTVQIYIMPVCLFFFWGGTEVIVRCTVNPVTQGSSLDSGHCHCGAGTDVS